MKTYQFPADSPLVRVVLHTPPEGEASAHLVARADMPPATLQQWRKALCDSGARCVPLVSDTLIVTGFTDEASLLATLRAQGMISGNPMQAETLEATAKTGAVTQAIHNRSLQFAGLLNLTGDVSLGIDGLKNKQWFKTTAGGIYTLGALAISLFGKSDTKRNQRLLEQKTADFLRGELGTLAEGSSLADIDQKRPSDVWGRGKEFVQQYPAQVTLGAYTVGAFLMLLQGIKEFRLNRASWETLAYGISSLCIKIATFFIPENPNISEEKPPETIFGKAANWIREKPLRLFGFGSFITDGFLLKGALKKYAVSQKTFSDKLGIGTGGAYIGSDLLAAVSNKDMTHNGGALDTAEQERLEALSAEAIYLTKGDADTTLHAERAAQFLKKQTVTKQSGDHLRERIIEKIQALRNNPWVTRAEEAHPEPLGR
jgi:hypothetical protein